LPLVGLFSSDPENEQYLVGELAISLMDEPQGWGRIKTIARHEKRMASTFDLRKCDPLRVMYNAKTRRYTIIDGVHRKRAAFAFGVSVLPVRVERNCTEIEAAEIVNGRANYRNLTPADRFRNDVAAHHPDALAVRDVLEELGLYVYVDPNRVTPYRAHVTTIAVIRWIHDQNGEPELREILSCIDQAWGLEMPVALSAPVLKGAREFWVWYHGKFDHAGLVAHLKKTDPQTLIRQADQMRGASRPRMQAKDAVRMVLRDLYNTGRRSGRLD
jgi:hypothetical protein